ncbi:amidase [Paenibacillus urinalis]|uniref:Amidase n=1 Tax=Paenibacillus urinalis TaxID=521520 RepID=A0AAX3MX52_9BACL|nr:amidase [Paenibacillus urinalis]WDH81394.1 amidase [Paenibacillus urinalis]
MDRWGAFVKSIGDISVHERGSLKGLRFAVKDVYDIQNHVSSAGNPDFQRTHHPAKNYAPILLRILEEGAQLVGATHTDELMFGLNGENEHWGTPVNPKAQGRIPGGSSSGSAVSVAAEMVHFALGTDTAGSVRVPSSYCGVYGIRPTWGCLSLTGVVPLAPSFDTPGWMANEIETMLKVGKTLFKGDARENDRNELRFVWASDMWDLVDEQVQEELGVRFGQLRSALNCDEEAITEGMQFELMDWVRAFRTLQGYEIWRTHGPWIEEVNPRFGAAVRERFEWAKGIQAEDAELAREDVKQVRAFLHEKLQKNTVLIVPTTPSIAPEIGLMGKEAEQIRISTMQLCCVAGIGGLPQVNVPWMEVQGYPFGLSFIAGPGRDMDLLRLIANIESELKLVLRKEHVR